MNLVSLLPHLVYFNLGDNLVFKLFVMVKQIGFIVS